MSRQSINEYRNELDRLRAASGSRRESVLREAFKDLLKRWGRAQDLVFVPEHDIVTPQKNRIYVDGALLHPLRVLVVGHALGHLLLCLRLRCRLLCARWLRWRGLLLTLRLLRGNRRKRQQPQAHDLHR